MTLASGTARLDHSGLRYSSRLPATRMRSAGALAAWAPIIRLSTVTTRPKISVTGLLSVLKIARLTAAAKARRAAR